MLSIPCLADVSITGSIKKILVCLVLHTHRTHVDRHIQAVQITNTRDRAVLRGECKRRRSEGTGQEEKKEKTGPAGAPLSSDGPTRWVVSLFI